MIFTSQNYHMGLLYNIMNNNIDTKILHAFSELELQNNVIFYIQKEI